jgi:hypothetical protein
MGEWLITTRARELAKSQSAVQATPSNAAVLLPCTMCTRTLVRTYILAYGKSLLYGTLFCLHVELLLLYCTVPCVRFIRRNQSRIQPHVKEASGLIPETQGRRFSDDPTHRMI